MCIRDSSYSSSGSELILMYLDDQGGEGGLQGGEELAVITLAAREADEGAPLVCMAVSYTHLEPEEPAATAEPTAEPEESVATAEPTVEPEEPAATAEPTAEPEEAVATAEPTAEPEEPAATAEPTAEPEEPVATAEPTSEPVLSLIHI